MLFVSVLSTPLTPKQLQKIGWVLPSPSRIFTPDFFHVWGHETITICCYIETMQRPPTPTTNGERLLDRGDL